MSGDFQVTTLSGSLFYFNHWRGSQGQGNNTCSMFPETMSPSHGSATSELSQIFGGKCNYPCNSFGFVQPGWLLTWHTKGQSHRLPICRAAVASIPWGWSSRRYWKIGCGCNRSVRISQCCTDINPDQSSDVADAPFLPSSSESSVGLAGLEMDKSTITRWMNKSFTQRETSITAVYGAHSRKLLHLERYLQSTEQGSHSFLGHLHEPSPAE